GGLVDLPRGFQYRIISGQDARLSNGAPVPGEHDGMAAFRGPGNTTVLTRNHELGFMDKAESPVVGKNPYDRTERGGTTGVLVGPDRREISSFVISSGTRNNCAGGATPWGTWLTCEEDRTTDHGYVFEVDPRAPENGLSKTPIRQMGFFSHEAVVVDPATGIVYLTEDDFRGFVVPDPEDETPGTRMRVSFLYRYLPDIRPRRPGHLQRGGKLQVMSLEESPRYNADLAAPRQRFGVIWKNVDPEEPHADAKSQNAARFNRLEGACLAGGSLWFSDTMGGEQRLGQVFRYRPATELLELFYEGVKPGKMESPDNIVVTPWGDLWFAEDETVEGNKKNRMAGITPDGQVYVFASNRLNNSEFAGPTFSPDGKTFFVNLQNPGITLAIWGPFREPSGRNQRRLAAAPPPGSSTPGISERLTEVADRYGMKHLEAAAYERLGALPT
ncbi:MAG TPA: alkaline phosphatase PhoX, partial [Rubrobacter sp.]|nr:alkaline phosphatase PhoX [Rubrobacter sp.]